ncbi:phosphotransferase [Flexivirga sp. ID2601S]|uniref:Phosphotransferase n=1 Tax=Flexivirga aerilata TaxID=1656889 RepID=A0A849AKE2_9MICO|nr:phosphotransferase [Flexivirga aerilata]NNG41294.1 phosphotransferase [Flexivirga aerilata]
MTSPDPLEIGELLASGATADVYALGRGRVLRRYRDPAWPADRVARAARLARNAGVPTPLVLLAAGPDLVVERVDGPTMLHQLAAGRMATDEAMTVLADLHRSTHRVRRAPHVDLPETGGDQLIHLDLHPNNVLIGPDGPVLIDWENAAWGAPGLDVAVTAVILACYALAYLADRHPNATDLLDAFLTVAEPLDRLDDAVEFRRSRTAFMPAAEAAQLDRAAGLIRYLSG